MKRFIFFVLLSFSFYALIAQELKITMDKTSESIMLFNEVRFNISIVNTSDDPILIYKGTDTKYGGIKKGWSLKVNGKGKSLPGNSYPRMLKYRKFHFKNLQPGESLSLPFESRRFRIKDEGKYEITFSFNQTNGGMDLKQGHSGQAKELAKKITNLDLEKTYEFNVAPMIPKKLVAKNITLKELKDAPVLHSARKASLDPTDAYKVFVEFSYDDEVDEREIESLGQLKNMRSLSINVGKHDITLPKEIVDIPLMELLLSSKGGKIIFPENFLTKPSLRVLYLTRLEYLPSFAKNHPQLEILYLIKLNLVEIPEWVSNLKNLKTLGFFLDPISALPESLLKLTTLEQFVAQGIQIQELKNIFNNKKLKTIRIEGSKIESISIKISSLKECENFQVTDGKLKAFPKEIFEMESLKQLILTNNELTILPDGIEKLSNLEFLNFSNNQIEHLPKGVHKIKSLRQFYMSRNPIKKDEEFMKVKRQFDVDRKKQFMF
jgi:hypothetical protein